MRPLIEAHPRETRIDLHLHSRASTDTGSWFLNRAVLPESYTAPAAAYAAAKRRGMDLVALTGVRASIVEGLEELRAAGLDPAGFIAPAYAHPPAADAICRAAGLGWWATRASLRWEGGRRSLPSLGLGVSTGPRRALSPAIARAAAQALARVGVVRLDLHPADLRHRRLAVSGRDLLNRLLEQDRRPVTHAELGLSAAPPDPAGRPDPVTRGGRTRDRARGAARPG